MNIYEVLNPLSVLCKISQQSLGYLSVTFKSGYCQYDNSDLNLERWSKCHCPIIIGKGIFPSIAETKDLLAVGMCSL